MNTRCWFALLSAALLIGGLPVPAAAQTLLEDEFNSRDLNWRYWCPCQIDMKGAPIEFPPDPDQGGDGIARITVNAAALGGNKCHDTESPYECRPPVASLAFVQYDKGDETTDGPDLPEPLGPSLVRPLAKRLRAEKPKNPYCTEEEHECIQRQELRFQKPYRHNADKPHRYSLRFRMPATIENRKDSIRWVTAQWKHEPVRIKDGVDPSPFLAQRFDNGVLHVTVQDEHCRCKVASAPNADGSIDVWRDGPALYCEWTKPTQEGACPAALEVKYGANPVLPSALGQWVEMSYRVEVGRSGKAVIEVHAGGQFIVRVTGKIGYEPVPGRPSVTKFKIGHYRDYMPFEHAMEIDWLKVAPVN